MLGRQRAGHARHRIEPQPRKQDAPPAEAVGQRAPDELGGREPGQEQRDGELGGGRVGAVEGGQRGQRGQEHVDGQRPQPHHRGEEDGDGAQAHPRFAGRRQAANSRRSRPGRPQPGMTAPLVHRPHAVHPHAVHAHGRRVEPARPGGQVVHAALGAAAHRLRVEEHEVGPGARAEPAAAGNAVGVGHRARHRAHRLLEGEVAALARPVPEEVQAEARVAEEGEVRARVGQGHRGVGVVQQPLHLGLVDVEEAAVEHGVELAVEAEVEEGVPRVLAALAGQLADGLALEPPVLGARHLRDRQVIPVLVAEAVGHAGLADLLLERGAERRDRPAPRGSAPPRRPRWRAARR